MKIKCYICKKDISEGVNRRYLTTSDGKRWVCTKHVGVEKEAVEQHGEVK